MDGWIDRSYYPRRVIAAPRFGLDPSPARPRTFCGGTPLAPASMHGLLSWPRIGHRDGRIGCLRNAFTKATPLVGGKKKSISELFM